MSGDWYSESEQEMDDRDAAIAQHQLEERHLREDAVEVWLKRVNDLARTTEDESCKA